MAQISTLQDTFTGTTIDTGKWSVTSDAGTSTTQNDQLTMTSSTTINNYTRFTSVSTYDLTGTAAYIQLVSAGNQALSTFESNIGIKLDGSNFVNFNINGNFIFINKFVAGVQTTLGQVSYNSSTHKWFQISERNGLMTFSYSTDGAQWKTFSTISNPWAVTAVSFLLEVGTYGTEASTSSFVYDNFNVNGLAASLPWITA